MRAGKGYRIVYVGHQGHEEAVGTMAVAPDAMYRVESAEDVLALPDLPEPIAVLAQTTLSHRDWAGALETARERWPNLWVPGRSDLCFATTNRQSALMAMAPRCDAIVVIGSANSSNTRALEKLAIEAGCPSVHRVNSVDELPELHGVVGVTAGASAPEELIEAVIARLDPVQGVEEVRITDEDEYFPPPRNIRDLQAAIEVAATVVARRLAGRPPLGRRPRHRGERCARSIARLTRIPSSSDARAVESTRVASRRMRGEGPGDVPGDVGSDVVFDDVTKSFGEVVAVDGVSLEVGSGEFFTFLGPSGSGKTTCLRMIAGFEHPTSGRVLLHGEDVSRVPPYDRDVNTVFQDYALFPHMTVGENIEFGLKVRRVPKAERRPRAEEALGLVHLHGYRDRRVTQLSGGQRQRVALRACARQPTEGPSARRAARRARPEAAPGDAGRAQADPGRGRHHVHLRDPRSGRSARDERPHRGVQPRSHRADRHAR